MSSIFKDLKVLDLTRVVAGPMCTQNLADMGATVYKIERPGEGDDTRRMGPFETRQEVSRSVVYLSYNRGKQSVTVDIATSEGAQVVRDLAQRCDVVVENYKVGTLERYGLGYASLSALNPRLVYCSITGFGQTGPAAGVAAYDFILQGVAGPMSVCGQPDGTPGAAPMRSSLPVTDVITGLYATSAITSALYHRERTGEGQYIDMAMLDASIAFMGHFATAYLMADSVGTRVGNTNPIAAPSQLFECADGHLIIAAGNNKQWITLCGVLGLPELPQDPRFLTNALRCDNRVALGEVLEPLLATLERGPLLARLQAAGVPAGPVNDMAQVFAEPQTQAREIAITIPQRQGDIRMARSPYRYSQTPVHHGASPELGEHTDQVLMSELGLSPEQIEGLRERGVL
jgi:crotonobetainyl-CoA:carnitine CoA-transferase CaiB-like acyl-CoA transferase